MPNVPAQQVAVMPMTAEERAAWDFAHPIPDISPPALHFHNRPFRLGEPVDVYSGGPTGCHCEACERTRQYNETRVQEDLLRLEYARLKTEATNRLNQTNGRYQGGARPWLCAACGYSASAQCMRCHQCTRVPATLQEALDATIVHARSWKDVTPLSKLMEAYETIRGRSGPALRDSTARTQLMTLFSRQAQHCQCYECEPCHTMHARCMVCLQAKDCAVLSTACDCWTCPVCAATREHVAGEPSPPKCSDCHKYLGCCCRCQKCKKCGVKQTSNVRGRLGGLVENRCLKCSACIDCCKCVQVDPANLPVARPDEVDAGVILQRGKMQHFPATAKWGLLAAGIPHKGQLNPFPKRLIGQEIEVGGGGTLNMNQVVVKKWTGCLVEDGSLPYTGFEINTAPAAGDQYVQQIRDIVAECERTEAWVNKKCGLHTHVDASDFNIWSMRRLINLYRRAEPHLFAMLPSTRVGNNYCQECGDSWWRVFNEPGKIYELKTRYVPTQVEINGKPATKKKRRVEEKFLNPTASLKGKLTSELYELDPNSFPNNKERKQVAEEMQEKKVNKDNKLRYRALNVHSWLLRGTLEFRHGAPALELHNSKQNDRVPVRGDYIINWGLVCAGLVEAAARMSDAEVDALGAVKSGGPNANMTWDEFKSVVVPAHLHSWADETRKVCQTKREPAVQARRTNEVLDCGCTDNGSCGCDMARVDYDCENCN